MKDRSYLPVYLLALLTVLVLISQLPIIANIWQYSFDDGTYSHAYLIPLISGYLYWELNKNNELQLRETINPLALIAVTITGCSLVIFTIAQFTFGYRVFIILFYGALISLVFKSSFKTLFPAFFLIFLIPVWGVLITPLQELSTIAVTSIMGASNIPIFVEGNTIHIPEGVFEIAGGCSGLRYLIVSLAISSLFIFLHVNKVKHAIIFILLAAIGALITNWIRITGLILIGHYTNMESDLMTDHNMFGWYLYIPYMLLLFSLGQRYCISPPHLHKKEPIKIKTSYNGKIILFSLFSLLISSPVLLGVALPNIESNILSNCQQAEFNHPEPVLISKHLRCVSENGGKTHYRYIFVGNKLGESVDYYENKFIPINFTVEKNDKLDNWQTLIVSDNNMRYRIRYQFVSGSYSTNRLSELKIFKLKNALSGIRATELRWIVSKI